MVAHSVQDHTQLGKHIPRAEYLTRWALDEKTVRRTAEQLDLVLFCPLEHGSYGLGKTVLLVAQHFRDEYMPDSGYLDPMATACLSN